MLSFENIPHVVQLLFAGVGALLVLASVVALALPYLKPESDWRELGLRIRTWWYIVGGIVIILCAGTTAAIVALAVVSFLALKEYLSVVPTRRADHQVFFWAYASIPVQFYLAHIQWYGLFIMFIPVYMFLWLALRTVLTGETKNILYAFGALNWGLMTTVFLLSHVAYLLVLPEGRPELTYSGVGMLVFLLVATEINDVSQYVWGKLFGKHHVVPKVSPKKTWEGLLGGVITTTLVVVALGPLLTPLNGWQVWLLGPMLALVGFGGDIVLSGIKRDIGIKDYGAALPGHGGVLDRLDSLIFTAPLFFHFVRYFHY